MFTSDVGESHCGKQLPGQIDPAQNTCTVASCCICFVTFQDTPIHTPHIKSTQAMLHVAHQAPQASNSQTFLLANTDG